MDSNEIRTLLQKYWDCETTLEEESQLRSYFESSDIDEEFAEAASLFRYFGIQRKEEFKSEVIIGTRPRKGHRYLQFTNLAKIAAGFIIVAVSVWFIHLQLTEEPLVSVNGEEITDKQKALEETRKALMIITDGFNLAEKEARKINMFNEAQELIQDNKKTDQDEHVDV